MGTLHTEDGPVDVLLQRVPRGDGVSIWKISSVTVARIPALDDEFGLGALEAWLPAWMLEVNLLAIALWQWLGLMVLIVLAFLISWIAANAVLALGRPLVARSQTDFDDRLLAAVLGPLRLVIGILVFQLGSLPLGLAVPARRVLTGMATALAFLALPWLWASGAFPEAASSTSSATSSRSASRTEEWAVPTASFPWAAGPSRQPWGSSPSSWPSTASRPSM